VRKSSPDVPFAHSAEVRGDGGGRGFSRLSWGRENQNDCCMIAMSFQVGRRKNRARLSKKTNFKWQNTLSVASFKVKPGRVEPLHVVLFCEK